MNKKQFYELRNEEYIDNVPKGHKPKCNICLPPVDFDDYMSFVEHREKIHGILRGKADISFRDMQKRVKFHKLRIKELKARRIA